MNIFQDMTLGVYGKEKKVFHFIDPRVKLIFLVLFIIFIFFPLLKEISFPFILINVFHLLFLFCIILIFYNLAGIKPKDIFQVLFRIKILFLLVIIFRSFSFGKYCYVLPIINLPISFEGFLRGVILFTQIFLVMLICQLFTYTTSPKGVVSAVICLLSPLKIIRLPVEKMAKIFATTLYLIPLILRIVQEKGKEYEIVKDKSLIKRIFSLIPHAVDFLSYLIVEVLKIDVYSSQDIYVDDVESVDRQTNVGDGYMRPLLLALIMIVEFILIVLVVAIPVFTGTSL